MVERSASNERSPGDAARADKPLRPAMTPPPHALAGPPPPPPLRLRPRVRVPLPVAWFDGARGFLASLAFHLALLAALAVWATHRPTLAQLHASSVAAPIQVSPQPTPLAFQVVEIEGVAAGPARHDSFAERRPAAAATAEPQLPPGAALAGVAAPATPENAGPSTQPAAPPIAKNDSQSGLAASPPAPGRANENDLSSRKGNARRELLIKYGGSDNSEAAVMAALKWLAAHQMADGSWSLQPETHMRCRGQCGNPGSMTQARVAATSLALLPFLGAGNTHQEGRYKQNVRSAVYFLMHQIQKTRAGGALNEPSGAMYSHGLASIALCEAYAMTHDRALAEPAQAVVNFICFAQDPMGGGWRYQPQTPGDTSVSGWQIMALKSARMADLNVPARVIGGASRFLDSVQSAGGARYGYTGPDNLPSMSAIGLLCRMYLGWRQDTPALKQGVEELAALGPNMNDLYFTYYATQVLRHWGGPLWEKWNAALRDPLVALQSHAGHEAGSWYIEKGDVGSRVGGRLYCTSLATMILEVYYRHMPLYTRKTTHEEFPN